MSRPSEKFLRNLYLDKEIDIAMLLFKSGLENLQQDGLYRRKTFTFFVLLTTGLERIMKIIVYLRTLALENRHLSEDEFRKKFSHNLIKLRDQIVTECFSQSYLLQQPFAQDDLIYLRDDPITNRILEVLSDFARTGRYIYMDGLSDPEQEHPAPEALWEEIGINMINPNWQGLLDGKNLENMVDDINRNFVIRLEKLFRALCRLFVSGVLGEKGQVYQAKLREFWAMDDNELGQTQYEAFT